MNVWYDSDCGVCTEFINYIEKRIESSEIVFLPNSCTDPVPQNLDSESFESLKNTTIICEDGSGRIYTHHQAMAKVLGSAGLGYRLISRLMTFPVLSWLFYLGYVIFSRFRHKISALLGLNQCKI